MSAISGHGGFSKKCAGVKASAYAHADVDGRTGARASFLYGGDNGVNYSFDALRGFEHKDLAHIFAAEALRHVCNADFVALDNAGMYYGGGVVARVDPRYGVADRLAEVTVLIGASYAVVYGGFQPLALEFYILTNL